MRSSLSTDDVTEEQWSVNAQLLNPLTSLSESIGKFFQSRPVVAETYNFMRGFFMHWKYSENTNFNARNGTAALFAFFSRFLGCFCTFVLQSSMVCPVTGFTGSVFASLQECSIPVFLLCDLIKFYWAIRHPRSNHRFDSHLLSLNSLNE